MQDSLESRNHVRYESNAITYMYNVQASRLPPSLAPQRTWRPHDTRNACIHSPNPSPNTSLHDKHKRQQRYRISCTDICSSTSSTLYRVVQSAAHLAYLNVVELNQASLRAEHALVRVVRALHRPRRGHHHMKGITYQRHHRQQRRRPRRQPSHGPVDVCLLRLRCSAVGVRATRIYRANKCVDICLSSKSGGGG